MASHSGANMSTAQPADSTPKNQHQHQHTRSNSSNKPLAAPSSPNQALKPLPKQTGNRSPLSQTSPTTSRETSPIRTWLTPQSTLQSRETTPKPRDAVSPSRSSSRASVDSNAPPPTTAPSRSGIPRPGAINEAVTRLWNLQRQENRDASPSPRLKSPTPSTTSRHGSTSSVTKPSFDLLESNPTVERLGLEPGEQLTKLTSTPSNQSNTGAKSRGYSGRVLETVEEGDQPLSPDDEPLSSASSIMEGQPVLGQEQALTDSGQLDTSDTISLISQDGAESIHRDFADRTPVAKKPDRRRESSATVRKAYSVLVPTKVRSNTDASSKNMTVETETVASIPTTVIASAADRGGGKRDDSGSLRKMASIETIKPRKKKTLKKPPSIISGTTSSKADLFEAKVASAVDEDEDDSDETFVYESNPPETRQRQHRHHSRTPSATSMQSFRDRRTSARPVAALIENHRKLRNKRSMKFMSNSYAGSGEEESGENDQGTVRASARRGAGPSNVFLSGELYGQTSDNNDPAQLQESPFSQASRLRNARHSSKPETQMIGSPMYLKSPTRRGSPYGFLGTPEDERSPLIGSIRGQRARGYRRQPGEAGMRHLDYYNEDQEERGWISRFAGCVVMTIIILLVIMGAAAFLFATSKPLYEVKVNQIQNVLASEELLMLDLLVEAFNPNIVAITVGEMDVNVFARSRYVKDDGRSLNGTSFHARRQLPAASHDHGSDPITDPSSDPQTMLLGQVFDFDSILTFDGSPLRRVPHNATGEFRLPWPGNNTDVGGHERWNRVLGHKFELIVRGILKYQLPLSSRTMTVGISASVMVNEDGGD